MGESVKNKTKSVSIIVAVCLFLNVLVIQIFKLIPSNGEVLGFIINVLSTISPVLVALIAFKAQFAILGLTKEPKSSIIKTTNYNKSILFIVAFIIFFGMSVAYNLFFDYPSFEHIKADTPIWEHIVYVTVAIVIRAILEELLFRKYIYTEFSVYGNNATVLLCALVFAMSKSSLVGFPYWFIIGIILSVLYSYTSTILYPILIRIIVDSVLYVKMITLSFNPRENSTLNLILGITLVAVLFIIALTFIRRLKVVNEGDNVTKPGFFTPPMVIFLAFAFAMCLF